MFITHIHGDHQLGILKIMSERDKILQTMESKDRSKMYIVTPNPMMEWIQMYVNDQLKHPEHVVLVPSHELNPEN